MSRGPLLRTMSSSAKLEWRTPTALIVAIEACVGPIQLDPCADQHPAHHFARTNWTIVDDGLARAWGGRGLVYVNPPYGRALSVWVEKAHTTILREEDELLFLVPARTETRWHRRCLGAFDAACYLYGRLHFATNEAESNPAPFPSVLFYRGREVERFLRLRGRPSGRLGWTIRLTDVQS